MRNPDPTNVVPRLLAVFVGLCAVGAHVAGCSSSSTSAKAAGSEGGACYGNGSCNSGLACLSQLCVSPDRTDAGGGSTGGRAGAGGSAAAGGSGGSGGAASGGGAGGSVVGSGGASGGAGAIGSGGGAGAIGSGGGGGAVSSGGAGGSAVGGAGGGGVAGTDAGGPACGLSFGSPTCGKCLDANCCAQELACESDHGCRSCMANPGVKCTNVPFNGFQTCKATNCRPDCS